MQIIYKKGIKTPPPPSPKNLDEALQRSDAAHWAKAWDEELIRHVTEFNTWTYEDPLPNDKPIPYVMTFKAKNIRMGASRGTRFDAPYVAII